MLLRSMESIGLFGGSFNPVHLGHLLMALAAVQELGLSRLFFVPAAQSPFKPEAQLAPAAERLRLLRFALAGQARYSIDDQEIALGGTSYSIDTVKNYAAQFPGARLWYLIGSDHAGLLPKWRSAEELATLIEFAVFARPGQNASGLPAHFRGQSLSGWAFDVSASGIRQRVRAGLPIDWLVPPAVSEAIHNNRLYL